MKLATARLALALAVGAVAWLTPSSFPLATNGPPTRKLRNYLKPPEFLAEQIVFHGRN